MNEAKPGPHVRNEAMKKPEAAGEETWMADAFEPVRDAREIAALRDALKNAEAHEARATLEIGKHEARADAAEAKLKKAEERVKELLEDLTSCGETLHYHECKAERLDKIIEEAPHGDACLEVMYSHGMLVDGPCDCWKSKVKHD